MKVLFQKLYKNILYMFLLYCIHAPLYVYAAPTAGKHSIQGYLGLAIIFINNVILPLLFSVALLFFLVNATRYFVLKSGESEGRETARRLALYAIGAFVFLVSLWGIVNMIVYGLGFDENQAPCPDYLRDKC
jgi:succinate dehydrogenase/fumarate reductase cytochrome b subunit